MGLMLDAQRIGAAEGWASKALTGRAVLQERRLRPLSPSR
jgi:hypothetical protein